MGLSAHSADAGVRLKVAETSTWRWCSSRVNALASASFGLPGTWMQGVLLSRRQIGRPGNSRPKCAARRQPPALRSLLCQRSRTQSVPLASPLATSYIHPTHHCRQHVQACTRACRWAKGRTHTTRCGATSLKFRRRSVLAPRFSCVGTRYRAPRKIASFARSTVFQSSRSSPPVSPESGFQDQYT